MATETQWLSKPKIFTIWPFAETVCWLPLYNIIKSTRSHDPSGRALCTVAQWSPTFLAPGTGFVEDNFSTDRGGGVGGDGSGSNASDGERQMNLCLLAHLLLCGLVPQPLAPVHSLVVGDPCCCLHLRQHLLLWTPLETGSLLSHPINELEQYS